MNIRLLAKYRFFNPYSLILRSVSSGIIRFNERKPVKIDFYKKYYSECLNKSSFNDGGSKNEGFSNKLLLSFVFTLPILYAEEKKRKNSSNVEKIFISYHHSSKELVRKFVDKLKKEGYRNIWFDETEIHPGDVLSKKMEQGIRDSSIFISFISNNYIWSKNCRKEFFYAEHKNKKCFYLITEGLDLTENTGFDFHLNNDDLRLDLHKIKKSDDEKIDKIFNKLKLELNNEAALNSNKKNESNTTNPDNKEMSEIENKVKAEIENKEIIGNEDFIERENLFEEIDSRLSSPNKTVLLTGIPGVGKTSCAIEYILKKKKSGEISNYFYFNSDQGFKIQNSIILYSEQLNLTKPNDSIETKIKSFTNYLKKTKDKVILFFDNVDDFEVLKKLIDYKAINKPTILTSTSTIKNEKDFIEIKTFNQDESKKYLKLKLSHLEDDDIQLIINHIKENDQCSTYKLVLIASLMCNDEAITVSELIKMKIEDEYMKQLLNRIEKRSKDAIKILKYLCFLNSDDIPDELMKKIRIKSNFSDAINILVKYNLCKRTNPNSLKVGVSTHSPLKSVIQSCLFDNNSEEQVIENDIINILDELFIIVDRASSIDKWKTPEIVYSNLRYFLSKYKIKTDKVGILYDKLSAYERHVNLDSKQSLNDGFKALEIFKNLYKGDHEKTSDQLNNIGNAYSDMKDHEMALKYYFESIEMRKRLFKTDHPDISSSLNNIGNAYSDTKDHEMALKYYFESIEMM
jgi:hypothetical protein